MLELKVINEENFLECLDLKSGVAKEEFVDSVLYSLAEAWLHGESFQPRAIYYGESLIGFVSIYIGDDHYQIINFLIDEAVQGQGFGKKAAQLCIDYLKIEYGAKQISAPVHKNHYLAKQFWGSLGFQNSDVVENGYVFMRLNT